MNRALLHVAALALPLLGLGASWLTTDRASRQGVEWDVPVQGYDPRDFLQGHYVIFQYDWPEGTIPDPERVYGGNALCLTGSPPRIDQTHIKRDDEACQYFVRAGQGLSGRLYASRDSALRMQRQMADPKLQGVLRFRLRPDGQIVPLGLTFRPRPAERTAAR